MRFRLNPWVLALGMTAVCAGAIGWIWKERSGSLPPAVLATYMPANVSTLVSINVSALRSAGILDLIAGSPASEERDYKNFVDLTGFDYREDLDHLLVGFRDGSIYILMCGSYSWEALRDYAKQQGGVCENGLCRLAASDGKRNLSFYPLRKKVLALAASPNEWAAQEINTNKRAPVPQDWIDSPIMISIGRELLQHPEKTSENLQRWFELLNGAQHLLVTIGGSDGDWEMQMKVRCGKASESAEIHSRLQKATNQLKQFTEKEKADNGGTLSGMLAEGTYRMTGSDVEGRWPVHRKFLEALVGGQI